MLLNTVLGAVLDEATCRELPATISAESSNSPSSFRFRPCLECGEHSQHLVLL
jgi:hypothetical protein